MKSRGPFLTILVVFAVSLSLSAFAQNQDQTPVPDNSQSQASGNQQTPSSAPEQPQSSNSQPTQTPDSQSTQAQSGQPSQTSGQPTPASGSQQTQPSGTQAAPSSDSAPAQSAEDSKPSKIKHDGGKDDVDAIGNRKVDGMDWYSLEKEIRLGKQFAQQLEQSMRMVKDPMVTEYVNRIGQNLVRNSDAKVPFTIKVVDDDSVNAFALPGGFFYVNSGLILAADEEAELAGVMAHEIAHVCARHATRGATRAEVANILTIPLIFVGGGIGYAAREAVGIGLPMTFLKFSRGFEAEADYLGLQYMYKAGYDPNAFVAFFEKLEAQEKKEAGNSGESFFHPSANSGSHSKIAGGNYKDSAPARPVHRDHVGIRSSENTFGWY